MRFALWLIGLFAVATALALFASSDPGTVTVFWPPYRIDLSLNLTLALLLVVFLLLYLALRALSKLFALPRQAEQWRVQHRARAQHAALLDAWGQLNAGQPGRAAATAQTVLTQLASSPTPSGHAADVEEANRQQARLRTVAHWLLAQSAQLRADPAERDRQLAAALADSDAGGPGGWRDASLLRTAEWAIDAQRSVGAGAERALATGKGKALSDQAMQADRGAKGADARASKTAHAALTELSPAAARRVAARRLRLRAAIADGATLDALRIARQLARHGLLADAADRRSQLACTHLQAAGRDDSAWRTAWGQLNGDERAYPAVAELATRRSGRGLGNDSATAR